MYNYTIANLSNHSNKPWFVNSNKVFPGKEKLGPMLHSHRNQSVDLQAKSIDWFLFENNICLIRVEIVMKL